MKPFYRWIVIAALAVFSASVSASPANPQKNIDYQVLKVPQETAPGNRIEIVEFFGYFCPHCYIFDKQLTAWAKKHKKDVILKRVAVKFNKSMILLQKLFYTLSAMDVLSNDLHQQIFDDIQTGRASLRSDEHIFEFIEKHGVDRKKFEEMYKSFYVQMLGDKAVEMQKAYEIEGVPMIAIDGKYLTSPAIISSGNKMDLTEEEIHTQTLQAMEVLVRQAQKERAARK